MESILGSVYLVQVRFIQRRMLSGLLWAHFLGRDICVENFALSARGRAEGLLRDYNESRCSRMTV